MRLFVGVRLDESVIAEAEEAADALRRRIGTRMRARWVSGANMHLTARFIGDVDAARESAVLEALRPALPIAPFVIELDGCGMFPPGGPPRVIWIGLARGLPSLRAMHEEFDRRLAPLGFEPEQREFRAHLTLARITDGPRSAKETVRAALDATRPQPARCTVDAATVFQSRLSPKGAVYHPLFDVPCSG